MSTIGIIGAGAWGTALAQNFASHGTDVTIWAREAEVIESINTQHENTMFLNGVSLDKKITAVASISDVCDCDVILVVTPAQAVRSTLVSIRRDALTDKPVVLCSKGFEIDTGALLSQIAMEEIPQAKVAVLTGPSFASDVARGLPTGVTIAAENRDIATEIRDILGTKSLRPYATDDVIGTQIGGAVKNVLAIAAGIAIGQGLGESARAALITRGIAEMARLTSAMGGNKETLMGMCGMGDVMLTCTSMESRNYSLGMAIGEGGSAQAVLADRSCVTEGVHTAKALKTLAKAHAVDMPICETVYAILHEGIGIQEGIQDMLSRPFGRE